MLCFIYKPPVHHLISVLGTNLRNRVSSLVLDLFIFVSLSFLGFFTFPLLTAQPKHRVSLVTVYRTLSPWPYNDGDLDVVL